jgi:hypothetical protein
MTRIRSRTCAGSLAASVACALLVASSSACADDTNIAVAEALFRDARTLMAAGDLAQACRSSRRATASTRSWAR